MKVFLDKGAYQAYNDEKMAVLTREEQLLYVAEYAIDANKDEALRAFRDAGFGAIVEAARSKANYDYVRQRAGYGGGGLGGLLGTLGGAALGAQLGGLEGAAAGALMRGQGAESGNADQTSGGPLLLPTGRAELGALLDLTRQPQGGLRISAVASEGPAQAAGLQVGDVITSIAGVGVNSRGSYYVATEKAFDLQTFELTYRRDGMEQTLQFDPSARVLAKEEEVAQVSASGDTNADLVGARDTEAMLAELERLADLHDRGILSDEEFEAMKARILEGS